MSGTIGLSCESLLREDPGPGQSRGVFSARCPTDQVEEQNGNIASDYEPRL